MKEVVVRELRRIAKIWVRDSKMASHLEGARRLAASILYDECATLDQAEAIADEAIEQGRAEASDVSNSSVDRSIPTASGMAHS